MNIENYTKEQSKRLKNVFEYLKTQGITQSQIAIDANLDETQLSHLKSGKSKYIPKELLKVLKKHNINPRYIRLKSDIMINTLGKKFKHFEKFVNSWNVVIRQPQKDSPKEKYLLLEMDSNFYNFLLQAENLRFLSSEGLLSNKEELERIKDIFSKSPQMEEYVLIPASRIKDIATNEVPRLERLENVMDIIQLKHYIEE